MRATVVRADSGGLDVGRPASSESMTSWSPACIPACVQCGWIGRTVVTPGLVRMSSWKTECRRTPSRSTRIRPSLPVSVTPVSSPTVSLNPVRYARTPLA